MTLVQVVVEMDFSGLGQVDKVVGVRLKWLKVEAHFVLSGLEVIEAGVVKSLGGYCRFWFVQVVIRALFVTEDFRGDDEILRGGGNFRSDDGCLHDSNVDLRGDVRSVRGSVNNGGFSHGDDVNEESNDAMESGDDDGIRSVRTCEDSRDNGDLKVSDDDESGGRIGDDDN